MRILWMFPLLIATCLVCAPVTAEDPKSQSTKSPPVKDANTVVTQAGFVNGTVVKVTSDQLVLKINETVNTPGPRRTVKVNGRSVSVPSTKTKTVSKEVTYWLEKNSKMVVVATTKPSDAPTEIADLKAGTAVVVRLNKHTHVNAGAKPDITMFVWQVEYTPPVVAKK